jgi:hypothetical protein
MKDAMSFDGPYKSLSAAPLARDNILRDLAKILAHNKSNIVQIASPMGTATLEDFKKLPQPERRRMLDDPYYGGLEGCIRGALDSRSDTQIHIVCDLAEQYSEKCVSAFHQMRKRDVDIKRRCLGIAFSDDHYYPPLQMADMFAFCHRSAILQKGGEAINPIVSELIDTLDINQMEDRVVQYRFIGNLGGIGDGELE